MRIRPFRSALVASVALVALVSLVPLSACGSSDSPTDGGASIDGSVEPPDTSVATEAGACNASNCNGCCREGACLSGVTVTACGKPGQACESCSGATDCVDRACKPTACGPDNCAGCCQGNECVQGDAAKACGRSGLGCVECGTGSTCTAGSCLNTTCQATCTAGCCSGSTCNSGTTAAACGNAGNACTVCGAGRTCTAGACVVDPARAFDFVLVSAVVPTTNKSGGAWDLGGGLPDPYAKLTVGARTGQAPFVADTTSPTWNYVLLAAVPSRELKAPLALELWDDDVTVDDFIGGCAVTLTDSVFDGALHTGTCAASATGVAFTYTYKLVAK